MGNDDNVKRFRDWSMWFVWKSCELLGILKEPISLFGFER